MNGKGLSNSDRKKRVTTGSRLSIDNKRIEKKNNIYRLQKSGIAKLDPNGKYVMLLTDFGPRINGYNITCGELDDRKVTLNISAEVWNDYTDRVRDTNDMRKSGDNTRAVDPPRTDVNFQFKDGSERPIGRRRIATTRMYQDDVVWVKYEDSSTATKIIKVIDIKLSQIWRHTGRTHPLGDRLRKHTLGDRLPSVLLPCGEVEKLCRTCRIFGSVDDSPSASGVAGVENRQQSYRSHIRFSPVRLLEDSYEQRTVTQVPLVMGSPHPSAGQMYLEYARPRNSKPNKSDRPDSEWGSRLDRPNPRQLRGRKFYWAWTANRDNIDSHLKRSEETDNKNVERKVSVLENPRKWQSTVIFENLTEAEIGGLVAALQPELGFKAYTDKEYTHPNSGEYTVRLGGGKPLGFGVFGTDVCIEKLHSARSRYGGDDIDVDLTRFMKVAVDAFIDETTKAVLDTWPHIAAMLHSGHIDASLVSYPPHFDDVYWSDWWKAGLPLSEHVLPAEVEQGYTRTKEGHTRPKKRRGRGSSQDGRR